MRAGEVPGTNHGPATIARSSARSARHHAPPGEGPCGAISALVRAKRESAGEPNSASRTQEKVPRAHCTSREPFSRGFNRLMISAVSSEQLLRNGINDGNARTIRPLPFGRGLFKLSLSKCQTSRRTRHVDDRRELAVAHRKCQVPVTLKGEQLNVH